MKVNGNSQLDGTLELLVQQFMAKGVSMEATPNAKEFSTLLNKLSKDQLLTEDQIAGLKKVEEQVISSSDIVMVNLINNYIKMFLSETKNSSVSNEPIASLDNTNVANNISPETRIVSTSNTVSNVALQVNQNADVNFANVFQTKEVSEDIASVDIKAMLNNFIMTDETESTIPNNVEVAKKDTTEVDVNKVNSGEVLKGGDYKDEIIDLIKSKMVQSNDSKDTNAESSLLANPSKETIESSPLVATSAKEITDKSPLIATFAKENVDKSSLVSTSVKEIADKLPLVATSTKEIADKLPLVAITARAIMDKPSLVATSAKEITDKPPLMASKVKEITDFDIGLAVTEKKAQEQKDELTLRYIPQIFGKMKNNEVESNVQEQGILPEESVTDVNMKESGIKTDYTNERLGYNVSQNVQASASDSAKGVSTGFASVFDQVVENVSYAIKENKNELSIKLKPDNLGELDIKLLQINGGITANIKVFDDETRRAIVAQMPMLQEALKEKGINIVNFSMSYGSGEMQQKENSPHRNFNGQGSKKGNKTFINSRDAIDTKPFITTSKIYDDTKMIDYFA